MNNPLDKVYLNQNQLTTLAGGGQIEDDNSNIYTGDENTIYMIDDDMNVVQTTGTSSTDVMSQNAATQAFQAKLVSGTNIQTINNESILKSGNIDVVNVGIVRLTD